MSNKEYRRLRHGEIVIDGDEIDSSVGFNEDPKWQPVVKGLGAIAPDPKYPAHRQYRRPVPETTGREL